MMVWLMCADATVTLRCSYGNLSTFCPNVDRLSKGGAFLGGFMVKGTLENGHALSLDERRRRWCSEVERSELIMRCGK